MPSSLPSCQTANHVKYVVGITGGIASGKTTVVQQWQSLFPVEVIDTDLIARDILQPNSDLLSQVIQHFGKMILNEQGLLNRKQLASIIFSDHQQRLWLNQLMHPVIQDKVQAQLDSDNSVNHASYTLLVVPLLDPQSNYLGMMDLIVVIDCEESEQLQRLMKRDSLNEAQASAIISTQISRNLRLTLAQAVIKTDGDQVDLTQSIVQLDAQIREHILAKSKVKA